MKKLIILTASVLLCSIFAFGQGRWVSFSSDQSREPIVNLQYEKGSNAIILDIQVPGMYVNDITEKGQVFQRLQLTEFQTTKEVGKPELPMISKILGLPDKKLAEITILEQETTTLSDYRVYPFQTPTVDANRKKPEGFVINQAFYQSDKSFPESGITLDKPGIWRDVRISGIHVVPFSYRPSTNQLVVTTHLKVRVSFTGNDETSGFVTHKNVKPGFFKLYKAAIANFETLGLKQVLSSADTAIKYLIITNTEALTAIQPFVNWKNEQGYRVRVKTLGPNFNQPQQFKDYITQLFSTDSLEYVLMVGDAYPNGGSAGGNNIVPMFWWAPSGEDPTYSDSWYTCLDGADDHYADLAIGRFTYDNLEELNLQIQKTLSHYHSPDTTTNWAENSLLVAHQEEYPLKYTQCKEEIRTYNYPLQNPIFTQCYGGAGASNQTIIDFINNTSCGIFNYRGHGSQTEFWSWGASGSFTATEVAQLNNPNRMFVLFDVCCDNMDIVDFAGNCLCESFMKSPATSVAINGAIIPSYTIPNHDYDKEMYKAVFEEGIYNIGYVTNFANITVLNVHGNLGRSNVRTYLWLGDASLEAWTLKPKVLTATHDPQIYLGVSTFEVLVTDPNGPVENAMVCVSNDAGSIYGVAWTNAGGVATVTFPGPVQDPGMAKVTVTRNNHLPYQATIPVIPQSGPYVVKESVTISDPLPGGNNNNSFDYNEFAHLNVSLKNVGVAIAGNVQAILTTNDAYVTITDSTASFGDINPGATQFLLNAFDIQAAALVPPGHNCLFTIKATDGTANWSSTFMIGLHAPNLGMGAVTISDPLGNANGKIDPGETVSVMVNANNTGAAEAINVTGVLTSADPYITITASTANYGNIAGSASVQQVYTITADPSTPAGHQADFTMNFTANSGYTGAGTFSAIIGQIPILIVDFDGNNNSGPAMQAAITSLGITSEMMTTLPANLGTYSSIFVCLGVYSTNHQLTSAEGQALADYLNAGGRLYMEGGDAWNYDPQTAVRPMFSVTSPSDGSSDLGTVAGVTGTFTAGMSFTYTGDNNWIDHLLPTSPAFTILNNVNPAYATGVAYDADTYKTIACSHEFGGLGDGTNPSTKQELMHQYLIFFGIINDVLTANFSALPTNVCENSTVNFMDVSNGAPITWAWEFPGGNPSASGLQNPSVTYAAAGVYPVTLIVSDGTTSDTITKNNYIHVGTPLSTTEIPTGTATICQGTPSSVCMVSPIPGATSYQWHLLPASAGTISGNGTTGTIYWNTGFSGQAQITISGVNACGNGPESAPFNITLNPLPTVTMAPLSPVCVYWPAFALTGGAPAGGIYSGPGVTGNMFTPSVAGTGLKNIVYTYVDNNGCSNAATQSMLVSVCTDIPENGSTASIKLYPNPATSLLTLELQGIGNAAVEINMVNLLGESVYTEKQSSIQGRLIHNIDVSKMAKGIYYLNIKSSDQSWMRKIVIGD